jgi:PAS domain S-box-containing protein
VRFKIPFTASLIGALTGYLILSPFTMYVSHVVHRYQSPTDMSVYKVFLPEFWQWAVFFVIFGSIAGLVIGMLYKSIRERTSEIRETKNYMEMLFNSVADGIITIDRQYRIKNANKAFLDMTGSTRNKVIGEYCYKVFHRKDKPCSGAEYSCHLNDVFESGKSMTAVHTHQDRKGNLILTEITWHPLKGKEDQIPQTVAIIRDITMRKKNEADLKAALAYAESIVETIHEPLIVLNADFRVVSANRAFYETFMVAPEETENKLIYELGNRQWDIPELRRLLEDIIPQNTSFNDFEVTYNLPNVGTKTLLLNARRIRQKGKGTDMILLAIDDITERKQLEQKIKDYTLNLENMIEERTKELKESEKKLRNIMESAPIGIVVSTPEGEIIEANPAMLKMFGYDTKEEFLTQRAPDCYYNPKDRERFIGLIEKGIVRDFEVQFKRKDGSIFWGAMSSITQMTKTGKTQFINTIQDITKRKQAEQLAREAQEGRIRAERLAAIGKLSSAVGHELRNPIGAINNSIYFLKMVLKEPSEKVKKHLDMIEEQVKLSNEIITDMLEFARGREPVMGDIDINNVLKESIAQATVAENIEIKTNLDPSAPIIKGDRTQLTRVFNNLISNALDAMPQGGMLSITIRANPKDASLEAVFEDNGTGIAKENLNKIFEPLFSTKTKGIGLGLSICKMFVEKHGGTIEVSSEIGKGSTFTVKLPLKKA